VDDNVPVTSTQLTHIHNCRRLLRMTSELHVRGFQQLRVIPHLYSVGTWRCGITFAQNVSADHGAMPCDWAWELVPQYTSASERECFDWEDAVTATPSRLANMFLERFPDVSRRGYGPDWEYAGWFSWMLHETYPDCLPICQGEYVTVPRGGLVTIGGRSLELTSPPPGRGACTD